MISELNMVSAYEKRSVVLLNLLKEYSYKEGTFKLASGKEINFFIDCKRTLLTSTGHLYAGLNFIEIIEKLNPKPALVAGVTVGGCPIASAIATLTSAHGEGMDALYVRKEAKDHGTQCLVEGFNSKSYATNLVVLVEDVITTGGSSIAAIKNLRDAGYRVNDLIVLVDRLEGGATNIEDAANVHVHSLFTKTDFL